jgi:hypothetical protein
MSVCTCLEAIDTTGPNVSHCWHSDGLDTTTKGVLVNVRHCVWCGIQQTKRYGGKGGWR